MKRYWVTIACSDSYKHEMTCLVQAKDESEAVNKTDDLYCEEFSPEFLEGIHVLYQSRSRRRAELYHQGLIAGRN